MGMSVLQVCIGSTRKKGQGVKKKWMDIGTKFHGSPFNSSLDRLDKSGHQRTKFLEPKFHL